MYEFLYMTDGTSHVVFVTARELDLLEDLQRGAVVYRPARRPPGEGRGSGSGRGRVRIRRGDGELACQDQVADGLVAKGLLEVTARRAPGGFRLDYMLPSGIELQGKLDSCEA